MSDHADIVRNALSWCEEGEMGNRHRAAGLAALDALVAELAEAQADAKRKYEQGWHDATIAARARAARDKRRYG